MKSFRGLGIGLSLVFGCLVLALVAELYYLLWWKKRISHRQEIEEDEEFNNKNAKDQFIQLFCWKKPSSLVDINSNATQDIERNPVAETTDPELGCTSKDFLLKSCGGGGEESEVSEIMRLHNLVGPPRFLFTITEETKEDLESDDGKSINGRRSRKGSRNASLSDLILNIDNNTPILTPLPSPPQKSLLNSCYNYNQYGFNPLFESSAEAELNRLRSSPPPKFKFLRDAEEKLLRKLKEEAANVEKKLSKKDESFSSNFTQDSGVKDVNFSATTAGGIEEREGSFLKFIVGHHLTHHSSGSSQILPLASSPTTTTTVRTSENSNKNKNKIKPIVHLG